MPQNIVIEFTSNTEGITTAKQAVEGFDKAVAENFDKTNKSLKDREKVIDETVSGLDAYSKKLKDAEKAAVGAFGTKGIKEYQAAISQTLKDTVAGFNLSDQQAKKFFKNLQDEAKKGLLKGGTTDEINQMKASLNAATEALKELGDESENAGGKTQSLKSQLRQMKEELATLDTSNPRFVVLAEQAAELEDRIGDVNQQVKLLSSDTSKLDASVEAIQGIAGAFAAAEGAVALFGANTEEVQQTLLKVNAAMSILQGIQQVGALLDKNSALNIFLIKTLRLQQATATTAVAVAEGEAAVGAEALAVADAEATVAQEGLNVAMSANPAGALILSLGVLVGLIEIFIGDTEAAAKAQSKLNQTLEFGKSMTDAEIEGYKTFGALRDAELKKQNASAATIREADTDNLRKQAEAAQRLLGQAETAKNAAMDKQRQMIADNKFDEKLNTQVEKTVGLYEDLYKQVNDLNDQLLQKEVENETESFKERLKNHTAFVEAKVLQDREGSRQELVDQIAAIRAREQEELKSQALLPGEAAKVRAQAERDTQKVRQQIRLFDLNQEKLYADARLQVSIQGSKDEYNDKVQLLNIEQKIEVESANGNKAKILDIEARFNRDRLELTKAYNRQVAEDAVNTRVSGTNSELSKLTVAGAESTNRQLVDLKKKLIDEQAELEIIGINASEHNEELRRAKVQAVYDKQLADKKELEKQKRATETNQDEAYFNALTNLEIGRSKRVLEGSTASFAERKRAQQDLYAYEAELIQNASDADKLRLANGEINQKEFDTKELQRLNEKEALKTQIVQQAEQQRQQIIGAAFGLASTLSSGYFDALRSGYEEDLAQTQDLESKKLITQQEADKRNREIKRKQAAADKEAALFNIALQTAQNLIKDHLNPVLIALDLAAFIAQTAFVAAKKPPAFRYGVIDLEGPGTETSDSIPAFLSKGESVMTAGETKKFRPYLQAMRDNSFHDLLAEMASKFETPISIPLPKYEIPTMGTLPKWAEKQMTASGGIDYAKLSAMIGQEVAKRVGSISDIPESPGIDVSIDEHGFKIIAKKANEETEYRNRRYKF